MKDFFGKSIRSTEEDLEDDLKTAQKEEMLKKMEEGKRKLAEKKEADRKVDSV